MLGVEGEGCWAVVSLIATIPQLVAEKEDVYEYE